jgi:hypothetical protein
MCLVPIKAQLKAAPAKRITVGASERRCDGCKVKRMFNYMSACMLFWVCTFFVFGCMFCLVCMFGYVLSKFVVCIFVCMFDVCVCLYVVCTCLSGNSIEKSIMMSLSFVIIYSMCVWMFVSRYVWMFVSLYLSFFFKFIFGSILYWYSMFVWSFVLCSLGLFVPFFVYSKSCLYVWLMSGPMFMHICLYVWTYWCCVCICLSVANILYVCLSVCLLCLSVHV